MLRGRRRRHAPGDSLGESTMKPLKHLHVVLGDPVVGCHGLWIYRRVTGLHAAALASVQKRLDLLLCDPPRVVSGRQYVAA